MVEVLYIGEGLYRDETIRTEGRALYANRRPSVQIGGPVMAGRPNEREAPWAFGTPIVIPRFRP